MDATVPEAHISTLTRIKPGHINQVEQAITDVNSGQKAAVVLYAEIDKFENVKTQMGIENIDTIISAIGKIIQQHTDPDDFAARFGENSYTILTREADTGKIGTNAKSLIKALNTIVEAGDKSMQITASLGIAAISKKIKNPYEILACADVACSEAKEKGGNTFGPASQ